MALDPKKRTPEELARLQAVANPYGDSMASQIGQKLQANRDAIAKGQQMLAQRPQVITADSGQLPESMFKRPVASAAPKAAVAPVMIDPSNPASMQLAPPSRTDAYPARNPANSASQAGASASAGGVPAPHSGVTYNNGSGATFQTGDGRTGQLPAGVAVVRQKDGTNAFGATGASVAAASGVPAQSFGGLSMPTAAPVQAQPNLAVNLPRPASAGSPYALHEARDANAAALSRLDSQSFANSLAVNRGSRSARALQGDINGQMTALSNAGLGSATTIAGGDRDAANQVGIAGMNQQGENQRALLADTGATNRTNINEAGANARTQFTTLADLQKPQTITDANGNVLQVTGTTASNVVGADGQPVKGAQTKADGAVTPAIQYAGNIEQLKAIQESLSLIPAKDPSDPRLAQRDALTQANAALSTGNSAAPGAASEPPAAAIAKLKANPKAAAQFDEIFGKGASARYLTR